MVGRGGSHSVLSCRRLSTTPDSLIDSCIARAAQSLSCFVYSRHAYTYSSKTRCFPYQDGWWLFPLPHHDPRAFLLFTPSTYLTPALPSSSSSSFFSPLSHCSAASLSVRILFYSHALSTLILSIFTLPRFHASTLHFLIFFSYPFFFVSRIVLDILRNAFCFSHPRYPLREGRVRSRSPHHCLCLPPATPKSCQIQTKRTFQCSAIDACFEASSSYCAWCTSSSPFQSCSCSQCHSLPLSC